MATGISKNKWNGQVTAHHADINDYFDVGLEMTLSYAGKLAVAQVLSLPAAETVELWRGTARDTLFSERHASFAGKETYQNRLYFGDNIAVLPKLLRDPSVRGKVRLIVIDPPYATNRVYKSRRQKEAYRDIHIGGHYVEYIRRRLILLRELLAKDGSIYLHLDQNMAFHLKIIMDEVFGSNNFRGWITRKKCNPKNYTKKTYGNITDYILFYTKSDQYVWNRPYESWTEAHAAKEYPSIEKKTGRRFKKVPIHAPGIRNGATGLPWRDMNPPPGKHWQYLPTKLDEMDARGEIYWSATGNPRRKIYLDQSLGIPVQNIWLNFKDAHNQMIKITGYPTEKNPQLLARMIEASSKEGDLILDCFSGSGTTLAVASQLNRNWLGIDNSPEAIKTTLKRFAIGLEAMGDFVSQRLAKRPAAFPKKRAKKKKLQEPLPLFQLLNDSEEEEEEAQTKSTPILNDFSLHGVTSQNEQLKEIIEYWNNLQSSLTSPR
jgi:adenine-specific DNA-methyltransferase